MRLIPLIPQDLHLSNRPSATAQAVTLYRALEMKRPANQRIVADKYAETFLSPAARFAYGPLGHSLPALDLAERNHLTGLSTYVLCRHRFIDDHLSTALEEDVEQVVILGAGYDSRAYRFSDQLAGRPVFEVDLPPLSRRKASIVSAHPSVFGHTSIHRVEIDFRTQSLADQLAGSGFTPGRKTFVTWEGVAPYLSAEAVDATLAALGTLCGTGSTLVMDLWDGSRGTDSMAAIRRLGARAIALVGEPVTFGLLPAQLDDLLAPAGFAMTDLAVGRELTSRYATLGRISPESVYVLAANRW
jgi:methyltransferase (TIGR00027 family)